MDYKEPIGIYTESFALHEMVRCILFEDQHIHIDEKKLVIFERKLNKNAKKEVWSMKYDRSVKVVIVIDIISA